MDIKEPLISVITSTFQAADVLERTIKSVENQSYKNIEYLIIDGASTDNIFDIVDRYRSIVTKFISEPDNGIYDAWNKGVNNSKGDWIAFLGAGDELHHDALQSYVDLIKKSTIKDIRYISSKVNIVNENGVVLFTKGSKWEWKKFKSYMNVAHVGSLHSRYLYNDLGLYNDSYKIVGDYELLMRAKSGLVAEFLDKVTANMLSGGISVSLKSLSEVKRLRIETQGLSKIAVSFDFIKSYLKGKLRLFLSKRGHYPTYRK